ncbi:MAG: AAA family ATPase [Promethearchaeota archaeon]
MTKIYFIGDTHFGKSYPYRKDYILNISERSLDVVNNCEIIIHAAIADNADYVVFLGDLYDRKIISPTIRKIVREKIFIPLNDHNIKTIIIGGNHDSVRSPKRGVDIQELSNFSNVEVYTTLHSQILEINDTKLGFIALPYIRFDVLVEVAKQKGLFKDDKSEGKDDYILAQTIFQEYIKGVCENKLKECDKRILIGHYYLDGAKIRETNNPTAIYGEFKFTKSMIQKEFFDLVIFGHLHLKQTVWNDDRIIIPGSVDRIDMGEKDSDKFYCTYSLEEDLLEFHEIECRPLIKETIEIPDDSEDLTRYILEYLPKQESFDNAVCRLSVIFPKGQEVKIDKKQVENHLKSSFYADIYYSEKPTEELKKLREVTLDPLNLYHLFLDQHYRDSQYYEDFKEIGSDLLQSQFSSVDLTAKGDLSIKCIDIQNFNKYGRGPNKIEFDQPLCVIKGPTGSGKSSILDAITFALFKRSTRKDAGLNLDEILYQNGYVNLDLGIGDNTLNIRRKWSTPKLEVKLDGNPLYTGLSIPEKDKKIIDIIGYDYEAFTSSFFIRQQELQIFSSLIPSERHRRLMKLFKLGIFEGIYKNLKLRINELNTNHNTLEGKILGLEPQVDTLPEKEDELRRENEELGKTEEDKKTLSKIVENLRTEVDKLQVDASEYVNVQDSIGEIEDEKEQNKKDLQAYRQQQEDYSKILKQISEFKEFKKEKQVLEKDKERIEKMVNRMALLLTQIESNEKLKNQTATQYTNQIDTITKEIQNKQTRLSKLDTSLTTDIAFKMLRDDGRLTERVDRLHTIEIPLAEKYNDGKQVQEFTSLETATKKELETLQPKLEGITKDIFLVDELKYEEIKMKRQKIEIEDNQQKEIGKVEDEIENLHNTVKKEGLDLDFSTELTDIKKQLGNIQQIEDEREELEGKLKEQKDFSLLIEKTEGDIVKLSTKLEKLEQKSKKRKPAYDRYMEKAEMFGKKQQELQDIEIKSREIKVKFEGILKEIDRIKKIQEQIKGIQAEIKLIKSEIEKYTILREEIFHANGIPKYAIEKLLPAISIKASEILSDLTSGSLNRIVFRPTEITGRIGFEIYVFDGERDREASTFSGGEKTQINAAIRFAIMERIAEIPDTAGAVFRKSNTLFIDEGDLGTLDDEATRQKFVEKIFELQSMFEKIILITHLEDVAEQFPNRIVVGRDEFGNSKIY